MPDGSKKNPPEPVKPAKKGVAVPNPQFLEFAEQSGAANLRDYLIASAAYLSLVENREQFSESQLLNNLHSYLDENDISPETTERALTRLMLDGKILRVKTDVYTISKSAQRGFQLKMAG